MKTRKLILPSIILIASIRLAGAGTIVVNTVDNTDFSAGKTNLVYALQNLVDGDTINFAIPGAGVHTIETPADGYPLITRNNITIDGYSQQQPGSSASPNTASLHEPNNAQLMICLSSENGNALSMYSACTNYAGMDYPSFGFGDDEQALLGFFRASNAWIRGISFLATPETSTSFGGGDCKTICFAVDAPDVSPQACQGFHISGCWFGVDPVTRQVAYMSDGVTAATPAICIATYGTGTNGVGGFPNAKQYSSGTIGVARGSVNPRAEFNVFVTGYGLDSQGGPFNVSGNFWGVLPDGTTLADISVINSGQQEGDAFVEFGGSHNITIGTDGDGINDADEGNLFGSYANGGLAIYYYSSQDRSVIAGNTFGVDIHGNSFGVGQTTKLVHHFNRDNGQVRFGSDFNGVSDTLEANTVVDSFLFDSDSGQTTTTHWLSVRGNSFVNTSTPDAERPPIGDGQDDGNGLDTYTNFVDVSGPTGTLAIIPIIGADTTLATLTGTYGVRAAATMRTVLDLYAADTTPGVPPQGKKWLADFVDNSAGDSNPAEGAFAFNIASLGLVPGTPVTITATYIIDVPSISSVSHTGGSTTLTISGGTPSYSIFGSSTVDGTYTLVATTAGNTATFAAPSGTAFYKVAYHPEVGSGSGQTSPFSDVFTIP